MSCRTYRTGRTSLSHTCTCMYMYFCSASLFTIVSGFEPQSMGSSSNPRNATADACFGFVPCFAGSH